MRRVVRARMTPTPLASTNLNSRNFFGKMPIAFAGSLPTMEVIGYLEVPFGTNFEGSDEGLPRLPR